MNTYQHPYYIDTLPDWKKFRYTINGGKNFVLQYLQRLSARETDADFEIRKSITYCPAFAKAALFEVKNSIYQRMSDIQRNGGTESYQKAVSGEESGVDRRGSSMNTFLGREVILELCALGRVGIYVDRKPLPDRPSPKDTKSNWPYIYKYKTEDILAWYEEDGKLQTVLLQENISILDNETHLPVGGTKTGTRLLQKVDDGVRVVIEMDKNKEEYILDLPEIPFVILSLSSSLLEDVADYQISMLNIASSDLNLIKGNFPFYVEQGRGMNINHLRGSNTEDLATEANAKKSGTREITTGASNARIYPVGAERPAFIAPPSEPLQISMKKQEAMKAEIRQLINIAITNLTPMRQSAESKDKDNTGLETGLSYIGEELQHGERKIAQFWSMYEKSSNVAKVNYPTKYSLKTDQERRDELEFIKGTRGWVPSRTYQEAATRYIVDSLGRFLSDAERSNVYNDIKNAKVINVDPEQIREDMEAGLVCVETASGAMLYPEGEVEKAKKDHAERLARIQAAQSDQVRGVEDTDPTSEAVKNERAQERELSKVKTGGTDDGTRGPGK